jgi:hypothetical protein
MDASSALTQQYHWRQPRHHTLRRQQDHGQQHAATARPHAPQEGRRPRQWPRLLPMRRRLHRRGTEANTSTITTCSPARPASPCCTTWWPPPRMAATTATRRNTFPCPACRRRCSPASATATTARAAPDRGLSMLFSKPPPAHAAKPVSPLCSWASMAGGGVGQGRRLHRAHARVRRLDRRLTGRISRSIHD